MMILGKIRGVTDNDFNNPGKVMKKINTALIIATAIFGLQACSDDDDPAPTPPPPEPVTIVDAAVNNGGFTTLVAALQATGLDATLDDENASFTVFAPTDAAFALLGEDTITELLADTDTLSSILTYHVLEGAVNAEAAIAAAGTTVETVNGASVGLSLIATSLYVNGATVTTTDLVTDNGIIHVIDAVLTPPGMRGEPTSNIVETAVANGNFDTLVAAVQAADLVDTLSNPDASFTVFAPTDAAFAMIDPATLEALIADPEALSAVLLQHVVAGEVDSVTAFSLNGQSATTASGAMIPVGLNAETDTLTFGGANVVMTDIYTTNGIIHVLDMVVVGDVELPTPPQSIVDVARENGNFTTLVAALEATGLDSVLADTDTDFTVFAPTDDAFALLGDATIAALLADTDTLSNILLNHVISGSAILQDAAVMVAQSDNSLVEVANEAQVALSLSGSNLFVNKSAVSAADVMADNGVIHVIDQVILPIPAANERTGTIVDIAVADDRFETLVTALTTANLVDTLNDETATFTVFAPTDAAFAKIPEPVLAGLLGDVDALSGVLLQHVVSGAEIGSLNAYAANGANVDTVAMEDVSVALVNFAATMDSETSEVAYDAANQRLVGGAASGFPGFTLYTFDGDLGTASSACVDGCATTWPPVLVADGEVSSVPGLGTITRGDDTIQATYLGRPLYFYANDTEAGDALGEGAGDVWYTAKQEQVSLQIQGSNVIISDIYTTNGVIHVIDTVITETLNSN